MRQDKIMNRDEEEKILTRLTPYIIKTFSSSRRSCCSTCSTCFTSGILQNKKVKSKEIMPKYKPP